MSARKSLTIIIPAILAILVLIPFSGCEKYILPDIQLSVDTLRFSAKEDSLTFFVQTNVITTAKADDSDSWLEANPPWFDADTLVVVYVTENKSSSTRTATLPIKSEAILKNLTVIQAGAEPDPNEE